jgi:hypothetical protein
MGISIMTLKKLGASGPGFTLSNDMVLEVRKEKVFSTFPILSLFNANFDFDATLLAYILGQGQGERF